MGGPWEKFQTGAAPSGPWEKYAPPETTVGPSIPEMSGLEKFTVGLGAGLENAGLGIAQRYLEMGQSDAPPLPGQNILDKIKARIAENRAAVAPLAAESQAAPWYQPTPYGTGNMLGGVLPTVPLPGGVAGGALRRGVTAALSGGAQGFIQPTVEGENPYANAGIGAAAGLGGSAVMSGAGKVGNALLGSKPVNAIDAAGKKYGIRTTTGEAASNPIVQKTESWLEGVPLIGLKGFREKQNQEAQAAAKGFLTKYVGDPSLPTTAAMKESNDAFLNTLYANVRQSGEQLPTVAAEKVKKSAGEMLERYPSVFESIQDTHVKKILKNVMGDVGDKKVNIPYGDGMEIPNAMTGKREFSFDELWTLRKGLGQEIRDAKTDTARGQLKQLYAAVSDDMDTMFTNSNTNAGNIFREANESFKRMSVKFDVIREAYDKAAGTTSGKEVFSPQAFSTELKKLANDPRYKKNVVFSGAEVSEMTGLANIMQVVKRAGQFKENPPTGNRWGLPLLAAGTAAVSPTVALGEAGMTALASFLTGTTAGKRMVLVASKVEPNSPMMKVVMENIYNQLPKLMANQATQPKVK